MKKFLLVSMIVATASLSVFAADVKLSGDFYARGTTVNNQALADSNKTQYSYFDYDLNLKAAIVASEQATVFVKLTYDKPVHTGNVPMGNGDAVNPGLAIENAFLSYKFNTGTTVDVGLMPGNQWGTKFADTEINTMRVKIVQAFSPELAMFLIYQKNVEAGAKPNTTTGYLVTANPKDAEKDDSTTYYLAFKLKAGPITVTPLGAYTTMGVNQDLVAAPAGKKYNTTKWTGDIGLAGDFGVIGFEGEYRYDKFKGDGADAINPALYADSKLWGAYANIFAKVDTFKVGFIYAYASYDKKTTDTANAFSMGDDFNAVIVLDEIDNDGSGLSGVTVYKVYAEAVFGQITAGAGVAYVKNNRTVDIATITKDATATEIDASVSYAIDAATAYTLDGGYAMTSDWAVKGDSAKEWAIRHKMSIKF
jgi:hypothetical protein